MKYKLEPKHSEKYLYVKLTEEGYAVDIKGIIFEARIQAKELSYSLLYDFTEFINKVEISEIYNLYRGDLMEKLISVDPDILKIDVAIIGNPDHAELWDFTETTFYNAGISIKVFYEKDQALHWLARKKEATRS
ncbi:MAG: hypothetical protein JEZ09_12140 [Salinivirgaceae bacterium]|nr:hypothetical protein [Salinivirgaceae bacterium]